MQRRPATPDEILADSSISFDVRRDNPIRFRHFVFETYNPRAKDGVSRRQYSRSRLCVVEGKPHVKYGGELHEITGDLVTLDTGRQFVGDLRIKSDHLK